MSEPANRIEAAFERERTVEPSRWFRQDVMRRVRSEAELPPLEFPWGRFAAGIVLAVVALVAFATGNGELAANPPEWSRIAAAVTLAALLSKLSIRERSSRLT